jgi:hypothetical protein
MGREARCRLLRGVRVGVHNDLGGLAHDHQLAQRVGAPRRIIAAATLCFGTRQRHGAL